MCSGTEMLGLLVIDNWWFYKNSISYVFWLCMYNIDMGNCIRMFTVTAPRHHHGLHKNGVVTVGHSHLMYNVNARSVAAEFMDEDGWLEDGEEEFGITNQGTTRAADVEVDLKGV